MATVRIIPDLDTKPALKNFKKFSKTLSKPTDFGRVLSKDLDKYLKKFTYKSQIKEVKSLKSEFSKIHSGIEKSQKRQEVHAKIQKMRMIQAAKAPAQYAIKAYKQSEINQSFHSGMGAAGSFHGNMSSVVGGGFASTVSSQLEGIKNIKDNFVKRYEDYKQAQMDKRQSARENSAFSSQNTENGSGSGVGGSIGRGGFLSSVGSGTMVLEGLTKVAGFLVNMASTIGQKRTSAINSQAGTLGATGDYVGGGGGLFANSEVAKAQIEYNRAFIDNAKGGKSPIKDLNNLSNFASVNNMGLGQATGAMGEIQRAAKDINIQFIKGAATQSKILGLKQGEFLTKFADIVKSNRAEGFGEMTNSKGFLEMATGFTQNGVISPERGLDIAKNLDSKVRQGENGGIFGQLALVEEMNKNGGDLFKALSTNEREGITPNKLEAINNMFGGNKDILGFLSRKEGVSTFTEGRELGSKAVKINEMAIDKATGNAGLARDNADKSFFAGAKIGRPIDELLDQMQKDNHKLVETMMPVLGKTVETVAKIESSLMKGMDSSLKAMEGFAEDVKKEGGFVNALKKGMKEAFKEGFSFKNLL